MMVEWWRNGAGGSGGSPVRCGGSGGGHAHEEAVLHLTICLPLLRLLPSAWGAE